MTEPLVVPVWAWVAVMTAIVVMLAIDLFMHRDIHVIEFRVEIMANIVTFQQRLNLGFLNTTSGDAHWTAEHSPNESERSPNDPE